MIDAPSPADSAEMSPEQLDEARAATGDWN